ncbi:MAG: tRNA (adenosine(37)-N6)-threonylcarbamoyltransferase complex dimerization subunit type 1 TsaB [Proteobacteria bacterium]|nr:tRNA (adenosine(37)-N6)-threonylcarbamoyltransferase complex dimerization subunit type 1 TsaB [Pseudomonadota bacterium]
MKILAIDTSTTSCSVAIVEQDNLLAEATIVREQTHAKHLMDMVHTVIDFSGVKLADLDGIAVTRGPGTFTGLRIGIGCVKGLALASDKPVVGISSLKALAMQCAAAAGLVYPMLDARRGEVYFSGYRVQNGVLKKEIDEGVLPPAQAVAHINEPCLLVGSGARLYHDMLVETLGERAFFASSFQHTIRASTVAYLGVKRFTQRDTDNVAALIPRYIRRSDAEMHFMKKGVVFR